MRGSISVILLLSIFCSAVCWADLPHLLIGRIAEVKLSTQNPTAYINFTGILSALNKLTDGRSNSFVESTLWADDIKENGADLFDQYHYLYKIYDPDTIVPFMKQRHHDINVVNSIGWCMSILKKNKGFISFDRALMARMLMNIVGEIHQPLNTIQMHNKTKSLVNGDKGGLLINITTVDNVNMTLSKFVDLGGTLLQKPNAQYSRPLNSSSFNEIERLVQEIRNEYPQSQFEGLTTNLNVNDWGLQGYDIAISDIYPFVKGTSKMNQEYTDQIFSLAKKKVALAGYRLANLIKSIY